MVGHRPVSFQDVAKNAGEERKDADHRNQHRFYRTGAIPD
jgi:hypothetical protein